MQRKVSQPISSTSVSERKRPLKATEAGCDVPPRKSAALESLAGETSLRQLMTLVPAAVYTCDTAGRITFFNQRAAELWGREPHLNDSHEAFCGHFRWARPDGTPLPYDQTPMSRAMDGGSANEELMLERPDGLRLFVNVKAEAWRTDDGNRLGTIHVWQDVSERHQHEQALAAAQATLQHEAEDRERHVVERTAELRQINAQLEEFVGFIAHDLRAPLRSMKNFSKMLLEDYAASSDERAKTYARRIVRSAEAMDALILDLLAYGRMAHSDRLLTPVSVRRAWEVALAQNEHLIQEKHARVEAAPALPKVQAHEATLGQVLANLLGNALKFVAPHTIPDVRLWAETHDGKVRCWVEDNGIGIPAEYHERIFEAFARLNEQDFEGTGIGLSIVRKGIERMCGRVGLESKPGSGSRFWFELPEG
jgi:signal transduction histidine kinase